MVVNETAAGNDALAPPRKRGAPPVLIGWLATILILAELTYVAVAYRETIINAWPAIGRGYALLGLNTPSRSPR